MGQNALETSAQAWLRENFGLEGQLERLPGENINLLLRTKDEEKFVLKIVDQHMPPDVVEMEFALLEHARSAGFSLRLPYIHKINNKKIETGIEIPLNGVYRARLIGFLEGTILENCTDISENMLYSAGKSLARFDRAVADFDHPSAHRSHRWSLPEAGRHRGTAERMEDPEQRALVLWAFELFEQVEPRLPGLPQQVIHGDANSENILVENDEVVGLIDFGDSCHAPRVCDLAIALAYLMMDREDPLAAARAVIRGYGSSLRLTNEEYAVLFPLACTRLAVSVCMATARKAEDPHNPTWFTSLDPALKLLARLREIGVGRHQG
jgi:Ser/Thr protein kinase RdoA (MazF antagonist)